MKMRNWMLSLKNKSIHLIKLDLILILSKKIFSKTKSSSSNGKSQILFFYCHKLRHITSRCYAMQKFNALNNVWGPKRPLRTNPQGPKMVWVPKEQRIIL